MTSIRDAFVECWKVLYKMKMAKETRRSLPAAALQSALPTAAPSARPAWRRAASVAAQLQLWACTLLHFHDEAGMRLRSFMTTDSRKPARGRCTKVQQHAVTVHLPGRLPAPVLTELDALSNKTGEVLATSLERVVRDVASTIGSGLDGMDELLGGLLFLMVHVLVGDGVPTNNKAAKILWKACEEDPPHPRMVYMLVCVICASHMANLCVKQAVIGHAAAEGAKNTAAVRASADVVRARNDANKGMVPHKIVCGVITRLYKYLLPEYYSEFYASLVAWASQLRLVTEDGRRPEAAARDVKRRTLYGAHVISLELLAVLNNGLDSLTHYVEEEELSRYWADPDGLRNSLVVRLVEARRRKELMPDEKPTLSRFFTFADCFENVFLMDLIPDGHKEMIKLVRVKPQTKNQGRMGWVTRLYDTPGISQYLRRTVLCLQVTGHLHNYCAKEDPDDLPILVRLAKGDGRRVVRDSLQKAFRCMILDKELDVAAAGTALLATGLDAVLRFGFFEAFPFLACMLCMAFNDDYLDAIHAFVAMSPDDLDVGFGQVLQRLAKGLGSDAAAVNWLLSETVQRTLERVFRTSAGSSLPVERKHTQVKRYEQSRVVHLAVAARNQMHRAILRFQAEDMRVREIAQRELYAARKCGISATAWRMVGSNFAVGGAAAYAVEAAASSAGRQHDAPDTPQQRMRAFMREHREELTQRRADRIEAAKQAVAALPPTDVPQSFDEYMEYLRRNEKAFREGMVTASKTRRGFSTRLTERPGLPAPVRRLQVNDSGPRLPRRGWTTLLKGRWGWHGLWGGATVQTIFLISYKHETKYLDVEPFRHGEFYNFGHEFRIDESLRPLSTLLTTLRVNSVEKVYEFVVDGRSHLHGVSFNVVHAVEVTAPIRPQRDDDDNEDGSDTDDSLESLLPDDDGDDGSDSLVSVDEDLDSDAASHDGEDDGPEPPPDPEEDEDDDEDEDPAPPRAPPVWRHPRAAPGTWTIYETLWFYTTFTIGELDLKVHMKAPFTTAVQMGHHDMTKALRPHRYGETTDAPVRTKLLLRAWEIWRPKQRGWAAARESRLRHLEAETARLEADLRAADGRAHIVAPILQNGDAHKLLVDWVPGLVARMLRYGLNLY